MTVTRLIALLGDPVAHSLSPSLQNAAIAEQGLDARYLALRCGPSELQGLIEGIARSGGAGNITIPHKEAAAGMVEKPAEAVRVTGACNTFWLEDDAIHGDNTDVAGVQGAVRLLLGGSAGGRNVLLLGAGGAARAVVLALGREGAARIAVRNRTAARARKLADAMSAAASPTALLVDDGPVDRAVDPSFDLVINATPLGLDEEDDLPLPLELLPRGVPLLDLAYRPDETDWVRRGRAAGHSARDGGDMLVYQGAEAFRRWWNRPAPLKIMQEALERIRDAAGPT